MYVDIINIPNNDDLVSFENFITRERQTLHIILNKNEWIPPGYWYKN